VLTAVHCRRRDLGRCAGGYDAGGAGVAARAGAVRWVITGYMRLACGRSPCLARGVVSALLLLPLSQVFTHRTAAARAATRQHRQRRSHQRNRPKSRRRQGARRSAQRPRSGRGVSVRAPPLGADDHQQRHQRPGSTSRRQQGQRRGQPPTSTDTTAPEPSRHNTSSRPASITTWAASPAAAAKAAARAPVISDRGAGSFGF